VLGGDQHARDGEPAVGVEQGLGDSAGATDVEPATNVARQVVFGGLFDPERVDVLNRPAR
jgi:hypothetical protein